jgi:hypothetical protein
MALKTEDFVDFISDWYNKLSLSSNRSVTQSTLDVRLPFSLSEKGLLRRLFDGADAIYSELDRLQDSGFAVGYDILPLDIPLFDDSFKSGFSGTMHSNGS